MGHPGDGPATVETESPQAGTTYSSTVLAAEMLPNALPGGAAVSVYTFSADSHFSRCYGACARDFIPLHERRPGGARRRELCRSGRRLAGRRDRQVTYEGHPLYLYSQEQPLGRAITTGTAGNGNGVSAFGGTFDLVTRSGLNPTRAVSGPLRQGR